MVLLVLCSECSKTATVKCSWWNKVSCSGYFCDSCVMVLWDKLKALCSIYAAGFSIEKVE